MEKLKNKVSGESALSELLVSELPNSSLLVETMEQNTTLMSAYIDNITEDVGYLISYGNEGEDNCVSSTLDLDCFL